MAGKWFERSRVEERAEAREKARAHFVSIVERDAARADRDKLERLPPKPKPWLIPPVPRPPLEEELARLASLPSPAIWSSPSRRELLALGLIRSTMRNNLWAGDEITEAGLARLSEETTDARDR